MSYTILHRASLKRDLRKLDAQVARRADGAILGLADDPRPAGCVKLAGESGLWRVRIGDYRILYEIDDERSVVVIVAVAHRRDVYRGL